MYLCKALATVLLIWWLHVILLLKGTPRYITLFTGGLYGPCSCTSSRTLKSSREIDRLGFPSTKYSSQSRYGRQSVGQSVLVSSPIWGPRPDFCYCQTVAVLFMWGSPSDERTGLSFTALKISSPCHLYLQFYMAAFYSHWSTVWFLEDSYYLQFYM
jgi:hypothetical protein